MSVGACERRRQCAPAVACVAFLSACVALAGCRRQAPDEGGQESPRPPPRREFAPVRDLRKPRVLAAGALSDDFGRLAIDDSHVFWTARTGVWRVGKRSGEPEKIAPVSALPRNIALDEKYAYWQEHDPRRDSRIMRVGKSGGSPELVTPVRWDESELRVRGGFVYWCDFVDASIPPVVGVLRVPSSGGERRVVARDLGAVASMAVDDRYVYVASYDLHEVLRVALDGGPPEVFAAGGELPGAIVLQGPNVYYESDGAIMTRAAAGSTVTTLVSDAPVELSLAVDDEFLYWGRPRYHGMMPRSHEGLFRLPTGGGPVVMLDEGYETAGIAVDEKTLYVSANHPRMRRAGILAYDK